MRPLKRTVLIVGVGSLAVAAVAKDKQAVIERPALFTKLVDCRTIKEDAARLACYDQQVAALDEAERKSEVVVVDKQEVKKAKRGLFGLTLPNLGGLLKSGDGDEVEAIESTIKSVTTNANGKYVFILADDARWVQTDSSDIRTPRGGQSIRIRKATLGSYFANVNGQQAIRVRREN